MILLLFNNTVLLKEYDFREADERARSCPRHYERDCRTLSNYLVEPFRSANGILMARVIFSWICFNIEYDVESFFSGRRKDQSAASVLTSKQSVCQGYAQLYCELARFAGMKVLLISGVGKGFGFQNNMAADGTASMTQQQRSQLSHAWNASELNPLNLRLFFPNLSPNYPPSFFFFF